MFDDIKKRVCSANIELFRRNIVIYTWGNVSEIDDSGRFVIIKPSGVPYENMTPNDMVVLDLNGNIVEGSYKPSSDTPTHLELYKCFKELKSIAHTHSTYATAFAQAGIPITTFGTTHADYFYGDIPVTRSLSLEEIDDNYELNTGKVIVETFQNNSPINTPGVLVKSHGPFIFGKDAFDCAHNAVVLEEVAKMNYFTLNLKQNAEKISESLLNKHFFRKHGKNSYYGQK